VIDVYVSEKTPGSARTRRYAFLTSDKPYSALPRNESWSFVRSGEIAEFGLSVDGEKKLLASGIVIENSTRRW
jgi:hypothetical protein